MDTIYILLGVIFTIIIIHNIWLRTLDWSNVKFYKDSGFKDKDDYIRKQLLPNIFSSKSYSVKTNGKEVMSVRWSSLNGAGVITIHQNKINQIKDIVNYEKKV